jgi:hypothetical protein
VSEPIDYELWARAVKPASRDGFEDALEFVDLLGDSEQKPAPMDGLGPRGWPKHLHRHSDDPEEA